MIALSKHLKGNTPYDLNSFSLYPLSPLLASSPLHIRVSPTLSRPCLPGLRNLVLYCCLPNKLRHKSANHTLTTGKTAPKFLQDLLRLDPQSIVANRNILLDNPPQFDGKARTGPPLVLDRGSCKHEYYTHIDRCNLPRLDESAQQDTCWKVAASCRKCRLYLTLSIDYPESGCRQPCPSREYPLHHLRHTSTSSSQVSYHFECSNLACQAHVHVSYEKPILSKEDILVLTDTEALKRRYEHVLEVTPDREGVRQATPLDVFTRFKRYVSDSLNKDNVRRSFPARNKRFMEAFGTDCDLLLYRMGFRKAEDTNGDDQWTIPSPKSVEDPDLLRPMLERLVTELQYLMDDYCASHAAPNPSRPTYRDAKVDLARTLSAQDCMLTALYLILNCANDWQMTRSPDEIWV